MIARIRKSIDEKDQGFTLIELLVVIIIIGILAAIAIPVFLNQRKKAVDASIKSDLHTIATALETYYTDAQQYPATVSQTAAGVVFDAVTGPPAIAAVTTKISQGNEFTVTTGGSTTDTYCIFGQNDRGTGGTANGFTYKSDGGLVAGAAAATGC